MDGRESEDDADDQEERRELAERWRILGERLRERSPHVFEEVAAFLATSIVDDDDDEHAQIDSVYQIH